jgi:hypothetical protein
MHYRERYRTNGTDCCTDFAPKHTKDPDYVKSKWMEWEKVLMWRSANAQEIYAPNTAGCVGLVFELNQALSQQRN